MKICVVEDEQAVRKGIVHKLRELAPDAAVFDVGYGHEAAEQMAFVRPDLAFIDIFMPELNGLALIKLVKEKLTDTRFVILTGYGEFQYAREALQLGVHNYLLKPVYHKDLLAEIEECRLLLRKRAEAELAEGVRRLRQDGLQITVTGLFRPGVWLDDQEIKQIVFASKEQIEERMEACILTFTISPSLHGAVMTGEHAFGAMSGWNSFRDRSEWMLRLREAHSICETIQFFAGDRHAAIQRIGQNPTPYLTAANKHRRDAVKAADTGNSAVLEHLRQWTAAVGKLPLPLLRREYVELLSEINVRVMSIDPGLPDHDWGAWVGSFRDWNQLRETTEQLIANSMFAINAKSDNEKFAANPFLAQLNALLDTEGHPYRLLTLDWVAERMNLHPVTLSRLFKKKTGCHFSDFLTEKKLNRAKQLLQETSKKVYEIAEELGYSDYRYFGQLFKHKFGATPQQLRRKSEE